VGWRIKKMLKIELSNTLRKNPQFLIKKESMFSNDNIFVKRSQGKIMIIVVDNFSENLRVRMR
jgi:hypothetical protein